MGMWLLWLSLPLVAIFYYLGDLIADCFLLLRIALGGTKSFRTRGGGSRLHLYVVETALLDAVTVGEVRRLFQLTMGFPGGDDSLQNVQDALLGYKYIALFRSGVDGSLRGMMLLDEMERKYQGKDIVQMKMGLLLFQDGFRGGSLGYLFYFSQILKHYVINFGKPVYVLVKSFSYKSYCIPMLNCHDAYPRYDKETPAFEQSLIDDFGRSFEKESSHYEYNPETGIVRQQRVKLETHQAPITEEELKNPHIAHFAKLNPNWQEGDCLVVVTKMTPGALLLSIARAIPRILFKGGRKHKDPGAHRLRREKSVSDLNADKGTRDSQWVDSFIGLSPALERRDDADKVL